MHEQPATSLAARLREAAAPTRAGCLAHPFVRGIANGSLAPEVFARWVRQDWLYLQTYVEVLERAAERAPTDEATKLWHGLHDLTVNYELDLHRAFAARFGISAASLDETVPYEATANYTRFLSECTSDSYAAIVARVLPCGVGYAEIGAALAAGDTPPDERYADWVRTYDDDVFRDAVARMESELDRHADDRALAADIYARGAAHELAFWEALWLGR